MADLWNVPAVRGGQHDRAPPERQEAQVLHQVQEQQLGPQIQRDIPLVSVRTLSVITATPTEKRSLEHFWPEVVLDLTGPPPEPTAMWP